MHFTQRRKYFFVYLTPALFFRWNLVMLSLIITDIWWDTLNTYMARGWSAFLWIFLKNCIERIDKIGEAEPIITFISVNTIQNPLTLKKNIDHSSKRGPTSFFSTPVAQMLLTQNDVKICEKQMKRCEILVHKYMTTNIWR